MVVIGTLILFFILAVVFFAIAFNAEGAVSGLCIFLALAMVVCAILIPFSIRQVDTGEIAVVKRFGKVVGTKGPGMNFDSWITSDYDYYDTKVQSVEIDALTYSKDAQTMDLQIVMQYHIMSDRVEDIATNYGSLKVLQSRLEAIAIEKAKAEMSAYTAMEIIAHRAEMSPAVETAIKDAVGEEYFVNVTAVVITNIDFSDAFENAVEDKMIAEQNLLKAEYENNTKVVQANAEAEAKIVQANAAAEVKLIEAQAEADAMLIKVQAEADAQSMKGETAAYVNDIVGPTITDELLRKMFFERWDGKMPLYWFGDNQNTMMTLPVTAE